jgi:hypothetical protein
MDTSYYNLNTPENTLSLTLMITGCILFKEGYSKQDTLAILERIGFIATDVHKGSAVITEHGIEYPRKTDVHGNVIPLPSVK